MFFKRLDDYKDKFNHIKISRDENGILEAQLHTDGADLVWGVMMPDPREVKVAQLEAEVDALRK